MSPEKHHFGSELVLSIPSLFVPSLSLCTSPRVSVPSAGGRNVYGHFQCKQFWPSAQVPSLGNDCKRVKHQSASFVLDTGGDGNRTLIIGTVVPLSARWKRRSAWWFTRTASRVRSPTTSCWPTWARERGEAVCTGASVSCTVLVTGTTLTLCTCLR